MEMDDAVGWYFDAKGMFSIKLTYKVQRAFESNGQRGTGCARVGSSNSEKDFWNHLIGSWSARQKLNTIYGE
jgi:hypothetical protein